MQIVVSQNVGLVSCMCDKYLNVDSLLSPNQLLTPEEFIHIVLVLVV